MRAGRMATSPLRTSAEGGPMGKDGHGRRRAARVMTRTAPGATPPAVGRAERDDSGGETRGAEEPTPGDGGPHAPAQADILAVVEEGSFANAACACGWKGPGRRSRGRARTDAAEHFSHGCPAHHP